MKAGKLLMKKYNLYWTPCTAHCIDLMFEDIGKRENVFDLITNARKITNFIYNYGWLLATMRKVCGGDIVRPRVTRFVKPWKNSIFSKKGKTVIFVPNRKFSRSRMMKHTSPLNSSHEL